MALSIKDPKATELAKQLALETGESITGAVTQALRERLERIRAHRGRAAAAERVLRAAWALPRIDPRTADDVIGYDEHGLPR